MDPDDLLSCLRSGLAMQWGNRKMRMRYEIEERGKRKERMRYEIEERAEIKELGGDKREKDASPTAKERKREKKSCRWSVARRESAEKSLLGVAREMGATKDNPVLRKDLREKARENIGDTGLLDYLLKHKAGEVLAGSEERFVRQYNSEGAIKYWLEPAELAQIGQETGILDPYSVPSALSNCFSDAHCKEINSQLKEEFNLLKR